MQFSIEKEILLNALNAVIRATATRGIQPVLSNILIETTQSGIKLCATDLDLAIEVNIDIKVDNQGSITLPAKKLIEIISKLPNKPVNLNLNKDNNTVIITCESSKFDLRGISSEEFPEIIYPESEESVDIDIDLLTKAIKQTTFAVATYDTSSILSGVSFKLKDTHLEMAATDGNRLAKVTKTIKNKINKEYSVVIPSRTLNEFSKILTGIEDKTVAISIKNGQISFKLKDRHLTSRLLEGQYPDYEKIIPKNYTITALVNIDNLINSLERTATMVNERTSIIKLHFNDTILEFTADTPDLGDSSDKIAIEYNNDDLIIAFNYKYILDSLRVMDCENVKLELGGSLSAALFSPDTDKDYLYLIMPVQIK